MRRWCRLSALRWCRAASCVDLQLPKPCLCRLPVNSCIPEEPTKIVVMIVNGSLALGMITWHLFSLFIILADGYWLLPSITWLNEPEGTCCHSSCFEIIVMAGLHVSAHFPDPEGPSAQYFRILWSPKNAPLTAFGTRVLEYWVLGASERLLHEHPRLDTSSAYSCPPLRRRFSCMP